MRARYEEMTYQQLRSMIDKNAAAGKYPQGRDDKNKMIWSGRPQPCCLCGGPVATYFDHAEVYGAPVCAVCCAMESSTESSEYWLNLEADPEIAHVNGDDKETEDDAE